MRVGKHFVGEWLYHHVTRQRVVDVVERSLSVESESSDVSVWTMITELSTEHLPSVNIDSSSVDPGPGHSTLDTGHSIIIDRKQYYLP